MAIIRNPRPFIPAAELHYHMAIKILAYFLQ